MKITAVNDIFCTVDCEVEIVQRGIGCPSLENASGLFETTGADLEIECFPQKWISSSDIAPVFADMGEYIQAMVPF